jgi:two-component system sensor histidine kinase PilS (NtrC family)
VDSQPAASRPPFLPERVAGPGTDLFRKLLLLTGVRLLVGTALLIATATLTLGPGGAENFPRRVEALLYAIIGSIYLGSLVSVWFLRARKHLSLVAHGQIAGDIVAASGLVYLTGGAESVFTILYPLAIVNAAIGLGRRGALVGALLSGASFCLLAVGMEHSWVAPPLAFGDRAQLTTARLLLTLGANLSAFLLTAMLAAHLAEALQGARTELAQRETELKGLEALHESILHSALSGILTIDGDGVVLHINRYGAELTGFRTRELHGEPLSKRFPAVAAAMADAPRGETLLVNSAGETRVVNYAASPLAGRTGQVIVLQDLTELRRMEEAVRRADRLAALGKLAAGLAHEIRNPLASMCGSIALLGKAPSLSEKDRRLMQIVSREGERLEALVTDFLAFARPSQPQLSCVQLSRVIDDTLTMFRQDPTAQALRIETELDPGEPLWVNADPSQLRQVLWNLLSNAADAMKRAGAVRVRVRSVSGHAVVEVIDSGPGIDQEDLHRVFDPFFTTKENGTGLGLAIVHRIVEAHGGEIAVESAPGRGTTVRVVLPAAHASSSA